MGGPDPVTFGIDHLQVRRLTEELLPRFAALPGRTFNGSAPTPEGLARWRTTVEFDRNLVVLDGEEVVGTAGAFRLGLTVPGGRVTPCAGITRVAVRPTHRRRGILTRMMRRQLDDLREEGEIVASLWASEAPIYGRFGYGLAVYGVEVTIERARSGFVRAPAPGRVREVSLDEALRLFPELTARAAPRYPGYTQRDDAWWKNVLSDTPGDRGGQSELVTLVHEGENGPDGFAGYRATIDWYKGSTLNLLSLLTVTDEAYAALWRHCLDVDLMVRVVAEDRSVEEPLRFLLTDSRAFEARVGDGLWVRLIDVPRALAARGYSGAGRIRLRVEDTFCPWNEGTYELEAGPEGATCARSDAEPDLALPAAVLGACYLGGNRFTTLGRAGLVEERTPGALARADALFASEVAPWNQVHF